MRRSDSGRVVAIRFRVCYETGVQRIATVLLALVLLLAGGPGWAIELCVCGDTPKTHCCCCGETGDESAAVSTVRMCERIAVDKVASAASAPLSGERELTAPALAPPRVTSRPMMRMPAPVDASRAWRGTDPPYLSVRSLRI